MKKERYAACDEIYQLYKGLVTNARHGLELDRLGQQAVAGAIGRALTQYFEAPYAVANRNSEKETG